MMRKGQCHRKKDCYYTSYSLLFKHYLFPSIFISTWLDRFPFLLFCVWLQIMTVSLRKGFLPMCDEIIVEHVPALQAQVWQGGVHVCLMLCSVTGAPPIIAQITKLSSRARGGNYLVTVKLYEPMGCICLEGRKFSQHTHAWSSAALKFGVLSSWGRNPFNKSAEQFKECY